MPAACPEAAGGARWSGLSDNQWHMIASVFSRHLGRFFLLGGQQGLFFRFFVRFFVLGHVYELLCNAQIRHEADVR